MKQNEKFHMNVGAATMFLIGTIFTLTIFAILSLRASYSELNMAEKTLDAVIDYYSLDSEAERVYQEVLSASRIDKLSGEQLVDFLDSDYQPEYDPITRILTYIIPSEKQKVLEVKLQINEESKINVFSWKFHPIVDYNYEDSEIKVWDGNF